MPARTARRTTGTRGWRGRSSSCHLKELQRSVGHETARRQPAEEVGEPGQVCVGQRIVETGEVAAALGDADARGAGRRLGQQDRKSTRLNSSHSQISYAVFCLKKKTRVRFRALLLVFGADCRLVY